ncbi:hypothetical protein KBZ00_26985 [Streptomyces sp. RK31]|uniref:hypothetical protein n=1 Tax=Streptomyces sp. RK31 TaxID=2824892 RepID=UPI001B38BA1E|nr:hypothetical protein [Streptomyces sp. RK31]MBQ0974746.1 hypothetical protein [Streptomyces sp. RK31]
MAVHDMTEGRGGNSRLNTAAGQEPTAIASRNYAERQRQRFSELLESGHSVYEARAAAREAEEVNDDERAEAQREGNDLAAKIARRRFRF